MKTKIRQTGLVGAVLAITIAMPLSVMAQSSSSNYRVEESFFGTGGQVDARSDNYRARQAAGMLGVGSAASNNFDAVAGTNTPISPFLEVYVTGAAVDLGNLEADASSYGVAQAGDCNCSFSVRSYLSSNYVVVTASQPPTSESGNSLQSKTTQGAPSTDTSVEEFGLNLVQNTNPALGAYPANQPDNTFADGSAAPGYELPNQFKYNLGDILATSPTIPGNPGVGKTDYTITYQAKVKNTTPAGSYRMLHDIIVVSSF